MSLAGPCVTAGRVSKGSASAARLSSATEHSAAANSEFSLVLAIFSDSVSKPIL